MYNGSRDKDIQLRLFDQLNLHVNKPTFPCPIVLIPPALQLQFNKEKRKTNFIGILFQYDWSVRQPNSASSKAYNCRTIGIVNAMFLLVLKRRVTDLIYSKHEKWLHCNGIVLTLKKVF